MYDPQGFPGAQAVQGSAHPREAAQGGKVGEVQLQAAEIRSRVSLRATTTSMLERAFSALASGATASDLR